MPDRPHTDRQVAAALGIAALALYALTLCPTIYIGDAGELAAVAHCFGVAHPPGYPLFTLLYGAAVHLLPFLEPALVCNALSAGVSATTVALIFLICRQLGRSRPASAAAAVGVAVARQFWYQAVSVEVYALDGLLLAASVCAVLRLGQRPPPGWSGGAWVLTGVLAGLCCGHRPVNALYLLLLALWLERQWRAAGAPAGGWGRALLAVAASGSVFLYLPLAALRDPPLNMGDPDSWEQLWQVITAAPYQRHVHGLTDPLSLERLGHALARMPAQLGVSALAAAVGILGIRRCAPSHRWLLRGAVLTIAINFAFTSTYHILDDDGFFQPALLGLAALAAFGWDLVGTRWSVTSRWAFPALALLPVLWTYRVMDLSGVDAAERYGRDLLAGAAPNALILLQSDTGRATTSYLQAVNGLRPDVAVLTPTMLLPWHIDEVRARAPRFDLPALDPRVEPWVWLQRLVQRQLEAGDPVYLSSPGDAHLDRLLQPDHLRRADLVPEGLLNRIVLMPFDRHAVADAGQEFWRRRPIPALDTGRQDPQLLILPVHYARARMLLGIELLRQNRVPAAAAAFDAVAARDTDPLEEVVAGAYRTIGRDLQPRRYAARARTAATALRAGASPPQVLGGLR